jgi:hypothetical protein
MILVVLGGLAGVAGLVAARWGRVKDGGAMCDALAVGVLVGLLVGLVPRLTGSATVVLVRQAAALPAGEVRSLAASIGPILIQNLAAALVIGAYILALRQKRKAPAPIFALALGAYALADGMASAAGSLPLTGALTLGLVGGLALGHLGQGLALGGAFGTQSGGLAWLGSAALLGGLLNSAGAIAAQKLGFGWANVVAVPLLACAVALLVVLTATIVGPGLGSNVKRLPVGGFLGGLGLTLVAARVVGSSLL